MPRELDLADIQGNILRAYGRQGFPVARYIFLHINDAKKGREFVDRIRPSITTAVKWRGSNPKYPQTGQREIDRPVVAINVAFTFYGLLALDLPTRTLRQLPDEFIDGMGARSDILGDRGPWNDWKWDPIWENSRGTKTVHVLVTLNAGAKPDGTPVDDLKRATRWLREQCEAVGGGVELLGGHGLDGKLEFQDASAILEERGGRMEPTPKEHFGFTDGIGDPVFEGQNDPHAELTAVIGQGAITPERTWRPLATGEFLLGYPDEAQELSTAGVPFEFTRNGTFLAYRKLHQNIGSWDTKIAELVRTYEAVMEVPAEEANETVRAKIAGRWANGVPLMAAPTFADYQAFNAEASEAKKRATKEEAGDRQQQQDPTARRIFDFMYGDDPDGLRCPLGAHLRRANPRDMLDPTYRPGDPGSCNGSVLNNRRRILRRGLPYGTGNGSDEGEHGVIMLVVCASLFRQFEFIQQQWMNYGLDFNAGNDTCPLIGNHDEEAKFVIASDPKTGKPPFFAARLPQFVEMRGGEYFFIPSMTALRMIAMGSVDPT